MFSNKEKLKCLREMGSNQQNFYLSPSKTR